MVRFVDAINRFFTTVTLVCAFGLGCGGTPVAPTPAPHIQWKTAIAGGYVGACLQGDRLTAARTHAIEQWSFPREGRPQRDGLYPIQPMDLGGVVRVRCGAPNASFETASGRQLTLHAGGLQSCDEGSSSDCAEAGARTVDDVRAAPTQWQGTLSDGREVVVGAWGRGLRKGADYVDWRPAPGRLMDATFDGNAVWAVGAGGLWRWLPGLPGARPVALPPSLNGKTLVGIFRDGPLLWVRDSEGMGWPMSVAAGPARLVGPAGRLPEPSGALVVRLGDGQVAAQRDEKGIEFVDAQARVTKIDTPPVTAIFPLDQVHVLVGDYTHLSLWALESGGQPSRLKSWPMGGPTRRIFLDDERIYAVGAPYGIVTGVIGDATKMRTTQSQ